MKQQTISRLIMVGLVVSVMTLVTPVLAFAHVVVKPGEALTGAYQTFTVSVPNEKTIPVTGVRLVIPDGVVSVTPTVKPGWNIETKKSDDNITEISWTNGTIPADQRDDFSFSAQLPSEAGDIIWKAYQTYQDGSVVSWDQTPTEDHSHETEDESKGPYSVTAVSAETPDTKESSSNVIPYVVSSAALIFGALSFVRASKK